AGRRFGDPAGTAKLVGELKQVGEQLAKFRASPERERGGVPQSDWRATAFAFEQFGPGWRERWDATGLAFRPEAGADFPNSGGESRKLAGALRSPTFAIDKPYLAVRVAGREGKARVVLNGLQLIQAPIYGGPAPPVTPRAE